ncbi:MAG TPA: cupin-like domain-containing protein [Candidatus Acidoferrum sp.]|nr:cupin-like domain-containing protein [Candidatus Acidoferrum sp.]
MNAVEIDHRYGISYQEFAHEYLFPGKPVIIGGAVDRWKAVGTWNPAFFKNNYGQLNLHIDGVHYTMADFIDRVESSSADSPAPYLRNEVIDRLLPELLADIDPLPRYFFPNWLDGKISRALRSRLHNGSPEIYIGGRGAKFPFLHFDSYHTHAFLAQIYGVKEYTTFTEDQTPFLYVNPRQYNASQVTDIENPDFDKFPLFAKATPVRFLLYPGEILFIPGGLWHTAKMLTPSISVSVNRANASNWATLTHDMWTNAPLHMKPLAAAYLTGIRAFHTLMDSRV